jgi:hypothetical protein
MAQIQTCAPRQKGFLFDGIVGTRQQYRPDVQAKQTRCERRALHGWNSADAAKKNLRRPTEILFGPLVLDWRGDSLRLVNQTGDRRWSRF